MFSQMAGTYVVAGVISGVVMIAAVMAEGRGAHLIRLWLSRGLSHPRDVFYAEMERDTDEFTVVSQLGAFEVRYAQLDARAEARIAVDADEHVARRVGERTDAA